MLLLRSNKDERPAIGAMLAIFAVVILFWAIFKQNGSALNTWASRYTERHVSGTTDKVLSTLKLTETVTYKLDSVTKTDNQFRKIKENGKEVKELNYPSYFKNMNLQKEPLKEGDSCKSVGAEFKSVDQSILGDCPYAIGGSILYLVEKKKREPSTPSKIAFGLLISALSVFVMVAAAKTGNNGADKVGVWWLFASYGVITIGELFLSPMGLSLVSKLSPVRITSLMMGGWFLSTSIGNKLSGILASKWDEYDDKASYFWLNFILLFSAAVFLFIILKLAQ
ncbi:MAG: hypothetical protein V9E88_08345 [Ferruginibacter sp.]